MARLTAAAVINQIGCQHLALYQGKGYWYFVFNDEARNMFDDRSVYTMRLSDMAIERWVEEGKDFVAKVEREHAERDPAGTFKTPLTKALERKAPEACKWFLLCDEPATTTRSHPVLGDVPCCEKHANWLK
jgi:hypothetical protein